MKRLLTVLLLLIFVAGCKSDDLPNGILSKDQMTDVLRDMHLVDGYLSTLPSDSVRKVGRQFYQQVFATYHIDSARWVVNLKYYTVKKPLVLNDIYKKVKADLDSLQSKESKAELKKNKKKIPVIKPK
ncbi:DUF4296 domain-containing protein [Pedobacter sp. HMF7647]|uniref:DUF4296 domain-containing protein n=1 Tax=Hufsiella arboris TaxID=2695275 RepID=A0A7K1Y6Q9_9SPHI|nr:DUF4296 domain-containing protein [Hufsiella arboris]MXV50266.1 DUF4296 domain-containing protein [Hufsiella arboris]